MAKSKTKKQRCSGKRRYRDHTEAVRSLGGLRNSSREKVPVRTYECERCKGWHLTSSPTWDSRQSA